MKEITKLIKTEMERGIVEVIIGKKREFKGHHVTPKMVQDFCKLKKWTLGEFETNGWQYDWWQHFTVNDKQFTAFGCGHDGDFLFGPDDGE